MKLEGPRDYIRQHGSALFIFSLIIIAIVFMIIGIYNEKFAGLTVSTIILLQLSGSLLAISLTALFLGLPDIVS